jgi:hypothetical protein
MLMGNRNAKIQSSPPLTPDRFGYGAATKPSNHFTQKT